MIMIILTIFSLYSYLLNMLQLFDFLLVRINTAFDQNITDKFCFSHIQS